MLKSAQPLFEFETRQKGIIYRLRLVRFARIFWLQRVDLEDWLAYVQRDRLLEMQEVFATGTQEQLKALTVSMVQSHNLARALRWGEDGRFFLMWQSRQHSWFDSQTEGWLDFTSQVAWHKNPFWTTTGTVFRQRFEQEWQNPECDARDALEYLLEPLEESMRRGVVWLRGGWEEIQSVLSAALKIEFDEKATLSHTVSSHDMRIEWRLYSHSARTLGLQPAYPGGFTPPEHLQRLLSIVGERNVRDRINEQKSKKRRMSNIYVSIGTPSMHEKIEARLFLRDWLREHAPQLLPDWE